METTPASSNPASRSSVILRHCPLLASQQHEHVQVEPLAQEGIVPLWQHQLDDEQFAMVRHHPPDLLQDSHAPLIIPIVQDLREYIRVCARWHLREEIAADVRTTVGYSCRGEERLSALDDLWQIEEDPPRAGSLLRIAASSAP